MNKQGNPSNAKRVIMAADGEYNSVLIPFVY